MKVLQMVKINCAAKFIERELQGWKKDGSSFAMELSLSEILTENSHWFLGSVRDLTKRKESEANRALLMNM